MNSKEAIDRIKAVLGISEYNFGTHNIKEGGEFKVEGELATEKEIYIITDEGELPSPDGEFELEDGTSVKVKDGKIADVKLVEEETEMEEESKEEETEMEEEKVEEEMEEESKKEDTEMASVSLIDGTIVGNDAEELEVGQELFVITEEGKTQAPDGEHQTQDGKTIVVAEGIITEIKEKEEVVVEEEETEMSKVIESFTMALESLKNELDGLKEQNNELKAKFSKFSNEPAGDKVYDQKTIKEERFSFKQDKLTALSQLRRK